MNYELIYILTPRLSEEEVKGKAKEIAELLKKAEVEVTKEDFWGKKELAYPIKHFEEGWYILCEFSSEAGRIKEIDKTLKLQEEIIRFLIVRKEIEKAVKEKRISKKPEEIKRTEKPARPADDPAPSKTEEPKVTPRKKKVDLEKLDEKLEKILGGETEI